MAIWGLNKLPSWINKQSIQHGVVATDKGFEDAVTGEVLVAIGQLSLEEGASIIAKVHLDKDAYVQGDTVNVSIEFTERVVSNSAISLVLTWTGVSGNITATAAAFPDAAGTNDVVLTAVIPAEAGVLSIAEQDLTLSAVFDALDDRPFSNVHISADLAAAVAPITVV